MHTYIDKSLTIFLEYAQLILEISLVFLGVIQYNIQIIYTKEVINKKTKQPVRARRKIIYYANGRKEERNLYNEFRINEVLLEP